MRGGGVLSTPDCISGKFKKVKNRHSGFTLAEMMVVMLILSIVLAAMAPVMTTRNKTDQSSPWHYTEDGSNAYFGPGDSQVAYIGGNFENVPFDLQNTRLLIRTGTSGNYNHITFAKGDSGASATEVGRLYMDTDNILLGKGTNSLTGTNNLALGHDSLAALTTGEDNTAIGNDSLSKLTTGKNNISVGRNSLNSSLNGENNTAIGLNALSKNVSGKWNIAIGNNAFANSSGGGSNVIIGGDAMSESEGATNNNNVAIGVQALMKSSGTNNVAIGANAMAESDGSTTSYSNNIAIGYEALMHYKGSNNVAIGANANNSSVTPLSRFDNTVAIGSLSKVTASNSVALGPNAAAMGEHSVALGTAFATEEGTVALGAISEAGGYSSTAVGSGSTARNTSSTALGSNAHVEGAYAIALGSGTIANSSNSIVIGSNSYAADIAMNSIAMGYDAKGYSRNSIAIGDSTEVLGYDSIAIGSYAKANGNYNIAIGYNACKDVQSQNKICIGKNSGPRAGDNWAKSTDTVERIFIGGRSKYNDGPAVLEIHNGTSGSQVISSGRGLANSLVVINGALLVKGGIISSIPTAGDRRFADASGNVLMVGSTSGQLEPIGLDWTGASDQVSTIYGSEEHGVFIDPNFGTPFSDRRLKYVGTEFTSGLDKIRELKVFNYTFKKDEKKIPHVGVIAQDLKKIFPDAVKKGVDGFLTIRLEDMFYAMINAIKELDAKYQAQEKRINELEKRIQKLEAKIK